MSKNLALLLVMSIAGCGMASANKFEASATGQFSCSDIAGQFVAPNELFTH